MKKNKKQNQESSTEVGVPADPAPPPSAIENPKSQITFIPLDDIEASPYNRKDLNAAALAVLAASIQSQGLLQPVLVRPGKSFTLSKPDLIEKDFVIRDELGVEWDRWPSDQPEMAQNMFTSRCAAHKPFQLIAGERRWRASRTAGLKEIPAIIRSMSDREVLDAQLAENLQREDLTALDEARAYDQAIKSQLHDIESLCATHQKSRSHVFARLRLLSLTQTVQAALADGRLSSSLADIIATIPSEKKQEKALEQILSGGEYFHTGGEYGRACMSARAAKELVEKEYRIGLSTAKFDKKAAALPGGPCAECPKRTGNLDPATDSPNVCTDPACFQAKTASALAAQKAKLTEKGLTVLTPKETKGLFSQWDPDAVQEDGRFLKPDTELAVGKKKVLVSDLAKDVAAVVAIDGKHKAHRLYRVADLAPLLKEKGIELNLSGQRGQQSAEDRAKEQAKREADKKVVEEVAARALPLARAKLDGMEADAKFWRFVLDEDYGAEQVLEARGLTLAKAKPGELLAVFFEERYLENECSYDGGIAKTYGRALRFLGVNLDKIRETVIEEQRAAKEGEPAKAGVPARKKKGKK